MMQIVQAWEKAVKDFEKAFINDDALNKLDMLWLYGSIMYTRESCPLCVKIPSLDRIVCIMPSKIK